MEGAVHTRRGFLEKVVQPLLDKSAKGGLTLDTALSELKGTSDTLHRFGIFQPNINVYLDKKTSGKGDRVTELDALLSVVERPRILFTTGTDFGSSEQSGYLNLTYGNVFGGAESLNGYASVGTRTRSAYELNFQMPVNANPDLILQASGYASSRSNQKHASHEEALKGGRVGVKWGEHEAGFTSVWRQITNLAKDASPSVRGDAGDSVKNSLGYTFTRDRRDNHLLPSKGYLFKSIMELAGWGGLGGDVAFAKTEVETQAAASLGSTSISMSVGLRGGLLYPLSLGLGDDKAPAKPSRINDRFQIGGPTDVRGFRDCGLGARDGKDSVGGDLYLAGGASIFFPVPRLGPEKPLRLQAFVNGGRLVSLQGLDKEKGGNINGSVAQAVRGLGNGLPSIAAGIGLVYAHPVARAELNFCLPIITREGERGRKGLQAGIGLSFL